MVVYLDANIVIYFVGHLATAVEHGCGLFLTNDAQLRSFPDIPVEVLT